MTLPRWIELIEQRNENGQKPSVVEVRTLCAAMREAWEAMQKNLDLHPDFDRVAHDSILFQAVSRISEMGK